MSNETKTQFANGILVVTRLYNAPRVAVFDAWIKTHKVEQWWGCNDTVKVNSSIQPETGGQYTHQMTLNHGMEIPGEAVFTEYDPPNVLAYGDKNPEPGSQTVRVEFIEQGAKTLVRLTHSNIIADIAQYVRTGWTAAFTKLDGFLHAEQTAA